MFMRRSRNDFCSAETKKCCEEYWKDEGFATANKGWVANQHL